MEYYIDDFIEAEIEVKYFYKGDNSKRFVLGEVIGPNPLICFGVNPSTAKVINKQLEIDCTIKNIKKIVIKEKYDGWIMLNLYAQVTPEPNELHKNEDFDNCLHKKNINKIKEIFENYPNADILACWGNLIEKRDYLKKLCLKEIFEISEKDRNWLYIGNLTKKGNPRHPLYPSIDTNLEVFNIKDYIKNL